MMIETPGEKETIRRLSLLSYALWEARRIISDRAKRDVDRDNLDWFMRERFDAAMEDNSDVLRLYEEFELKSAYDSNQLHVQCTSEELRVVLSLSLEFFNESLPEQVMVDYLLSSGFPQDYKPLAFPGNS